MKGGGGGGKWRGCRSCLVQSLSSLILLLFQTKNAEPSLTKLDLGGIIITQVSPISYYPAKARPQATEAKGTELLTEKLLI